MPGARPVWAAGSCALLGSLFCCGCGGAAGTDAGATDAGIRFQPLIVNAGQSTPRTTTWSVNYWTWPASYGDDVSGTESLVAAIKPALLRVGGHNNDANTPDPFDHAQLDRAVAYARAIGAEPLLQVPLLADTGGQPPSPATAADMVRYANLTQGYAVKYFSIGNEPDLYATQGLPSNPSQPALPGYTPSDYCASATAFVAAMKAVDPSIEIVGPDLSWKYQAGSAQNDWLTPILSGCGSLFDVIAIHRYPFEAAQATRAAAQADVAAFRNVVANVRGIMQATGYGQTPLALTEMNVAYDATGCVLDASPGTIGSALWLADSVGAAIQLGLWTTAVWNISDTDGWSLGLIGTPPGHEPRPSYYAYALFADHFGPNVLDVTAAPAGVSAYASRNQAGDATEVILINWNSSPAGLTFQLTGLTEPPPSPSFVLPPLSMDAVEIPDVGVATAWSYGEPQRAAGVGPEVLDPGGATPAGLGVPGSGSVGGAGRIPGTGCGLDGGVACAAVDGSGCLPASP